MVAVAKKTLPNTHSVKGKVKKWLAAPNDYGCSVGWYTDKGKAGFPYCPGDTIE